MKWCQGIKLRFHSHYTFYANAGKMFSFIEHIPTSPPSKLQTQHRYLSLDPKEENLKKK